MFPFGFSSSLSVVQKKFLFRSEKKIEKSCEFLQKRELQENVVHTKLKVIELIEEGKREPP